MIMADNKENNRRNKILGLVLKIGFSFVILYFLFSSIDITHLTEYLSNAGMKIVLLVFVSGIGLLFMEYLRFYISLKPVIDNTQKTPLWRVFFSGYALRFVIPGGHGELGKMVFVSGRYSHRLLAYLLDKGSLAIVVLAGGLMGIWRLYPGLRIYYFGILVILPLFYITARYFLRKKKISLSDIGGYPFRRVLFTNIPLSIAHVLIMSFQYWLVLKAEQIPFIAIFTTVNIVLFAIMIPVSFAGLGVREWTTLQLLRHHAISKESAILAPLLVFLCNVFVPALIGVGFILVFKMRPTLFSKDNATLQQQ